jgi:stearoyl-CoA desaturase (delta-9 desaturase)
MSSDSFFAVVPGVADATSVNPAPPVREQQTHDAADDHSVDKDHDHRHEISLALKLTNLAAIIIPFAGLVFAICSLWGWGFSWTHLFILVGMYFLTGFGITIGYHRLFTHKSFETNAVVKATLAILGSMAVEGPVFKWVAQHRRHHQHSDDVEDPHSPHLHGHGFKGMLKGLWYSHCGWIFDREYAKINNYIPDLMKSRLLVWISKTFSLWVALGLLIPTVLGGLITLSWSGALFGFVWGGLARIFLVHHITWSINSVCHLWGTRPFRSHDESRNNVVFGVLAMGEGWHNNHHAFPTSARHGLRWWQIDTSYYVIRAMELLGLAWQVRVPAPAAMEAKRRKA